MIEQAHATGVFTAECYDADGRLKWRDTFPNVVTTVGKNAALNAYLGPGATYTRVGPYMGLLNGSAPVAGDTMGSHSGWSEVGGGTAPLYSGNRKDLSSAFAAASGGAKALTAAQAFGIVTTGGTVTGGFLVFDSGAVATKDSPAGVLYSAGNFSGGAQTVAPTDTLNVSYSTSL